MNRSIRLSLLLSLALGACTSEAAPPGAGGGAPAPAGPTLVEGTDAMQFSVKQITVKAGQTVKITLKNAGAMPKEAMGHNLVVLREGVTASAFGMAIAQSMKGTLDNGHLPDEFKKDVLAHTKLLGPGETDSIEFTAPSKPCTLEYVCTFPGHFAMMNGKITVQ